VTTSRQIGNAALAAHWSQSDIADLDLGDTAQIAGG
jgi:hypothetical protein